MIHIRFQLFASVRFSYLNLTLRFSFIFLSSQFKKRSLYIYHIIHHSFSIPFSLYETKSCHGVVECLKTIHGFYLKGAGVALSQALINLILDLLQKMGYMELQPHFSRAKISSERVLKTVYGAIESLLQSMLVFF